MPVFEYRCTDCSKTYDVLHLTKEKSEDIVCRTCGSVQHKKLISIPAASEKASAHDFSPSPSYGGGGCCGGGACGIN